ATTRRRRTVLPHLFLEGHRRLRNAIRGPAANLRCGACAGQADLQGLPWRAGRLLSQQLRAVSIDERAQRRRRAEALGDLDRRRRANRGRVEAATARVDRVESPYSYRRAPIGSTAAARRAGRYAASAAAARS